MEIKMKDEAGYLYGGISGIRLAVESFALGEGIELRQTYCHLFSANMMAFGRPGPKGYHPAPWKAAKGGFGYDIEVEIRAPTQTTLGKSFDAKETIWWIAALLRLARFPYLSVPVISNHSFRDIPNSREEPTLTPFETEGRFFVPPEEADCILNEDQIAWVAEKWRSAGHLLNTNAKFYSALKAFDSATVRGRSSASMLALWGGLEQLFAPSAGELRFRVAALLSSYLEKPGPSRHELYKSILKLYNERSVVAHTAQEVETGPLVETYVIMRNALVRMIDEGKVPTQPELESLLFCVNPETNE
ncbi:hypothetical protein [Aeromonas simiae]|uniref:hypothetical protein n=1 Tax=Aeromonas simiae TaxID=218936 RepID=UPI00266B9B9A|nr:hypothetical protein [Aeromonas simiae]MDO2949235.1 hypothetical protein [Aeromonas simiae]MDO2952699.1 hypothetical protein [Aeromonas simiae]MDO2956516.1 hypothetical protein [Aeromonas simiae]